MILPPFCPVYRITPVNPDDPVQGVTVPTQLGISSSQILLQPSPLFTFRSSHDSPPWTTPSQHHPIVMPSLYTGIETLHVLIMSHEYTLATYQVITLIPVVGKLYGPNLTNPVHEKLVAFPDQVDVYL